MKLDGYPGVTSFQDRHETTRWRFRRKGRTVYLPDPDSPEFDEHYQAAINNREPRKAEVVHHPGACAPESFLHAWRLVLKTASWKEFDAATQLKNRRLAEEFLNSKVDEDSPELWRDMPVKDLRRRHLKEIIASYIETPTKAKHMLTTIRKMIVVALDQEWREDDPSHHLNYRPRTVGWKAWTDDAIAKFEKRWPTGTIPRQVYAVALWLGNRRGDIASLRKDQRCVRVVIINGERREIEGYQIVQQKGGGRKTIFMPITPMLAEALQVPEHGSDTVIANAYGKSFSAKSLTGMMAHWNTMAGNPPGFTLHGLRKSLGKRLAEADATTRQIMEALGHDDIEHAELYSREASQVRLAVQGMDKVVQLVANRNG